jgi:hypothetical protein
MSFEHLKDKARHSAEDKLLAKLFIKCKECDARMSTGRQEGKRYYFCGNNTEHEDNLDRYVWVEMPEYLSLEGEFDTKLSSEKETN